ncbi:conserved hypothetical protein [Formosa agariphila KMM 3901]|uniref:DUF4861 domain-containing protein n=1 Tax=Formosa agariphila (strain DSM 15362 / KCTC 12365 / LMG 23005 / KMM 3901 / M-2Alg 35-1) TaxID=1347342 RepID=T2KL91_FORAG|nr:DUF4861 domain-containing protein [Formosa agariphila]CDF78759.1 conserved hypothetical protein [Formosa agariphila KMM 3901]
MKNGLLLSCVVAASLFVSCGSKEKESTLITVKNNLELPRSFETIEISRADVTLKEGERFEDFSVQDVATKSMLTSQFVDEDQDGTADVLLFQPELAPNSEKQFELVIIDVTIKHDSVVHCYSRFVPERTDDYTWENDKVAFRTYGPVAQKMIEDSIPGGTLSSGIDAWLKKVDYPIIDKWYAKNAKNPGAYHIDHGEGLDNFHVGSSRGVGGSAVKVDTSYYISKNFTDYKTITNGPIRTSFVLDYADWDANGNTISEEKHISLDYGNNFSRFEIHVEGTDVLSIGLTLHDNLGTITENVDEGWISYWESEYFDSELGTAVVAAKSDMISSDYYVTNMKDRSNLYTQLKVNDNKVVYYAGFAWKESKQYPTKASWEKHIQEFAEKINSPLEVSFNK